MKILYLPLYRMGVRYAISFGRRWSLLEQMILIDLAKERRSLAQLAEDADLPERLVIEALINLLRTGWIEIRATNSGVLFTATLIGKRRATEENLPAQLQKDFRWISLAVDRITGSWFRAEDLDLVYQRDLPEDACLIEPKIHTYNPLDASLRDLVNLAPHEGFEASEPVFRNPSRPYARVRVAFDRVEGLPGYAPLSLHQALFTAALGVPDLTSAGYTAVIPPSSSNLPRDSIRENDIIVGGEAHLAFLENCISTAKTHVILHSCFVHPDTISRLLPALQQAGKRRVRVDLLWGLHSDPEDPSSRRPIIQATAVLDRLPANIRTYIQLSPISSGSHAKALIYDNRSGEREIVLGSCNFLSTRFDAIEISLRSRSGRLGMQVLGQLIAAQLPASGNWSGTARRLNHVWDVMRRTVGGHIEHGAHSLKLLTDQDHYACVTMARDTAQSQIMIGCDLYGAAAETSVLVPMERAAEMGRRVRLLYQRSSKFLSEQGQVPDPASAGNRGLLLERIEGLHGKFLVWDAEALAITSFNWMSTAVSGTRPRAAELGVLVQAPELVSLFSKKLVASSENRITVGV